MSTMGSEIAEGFWTDAAYARLTSVRWLVFRDSATSIQEGRLYDRAPWVT